MIKQLATSKLNIDSEIIIETILLCSRHNIQSQD